MLPADLAAAEAQARGALQAALAADAAGRWSVEWRFEGLRLLPVVLRLARALGEAGAAPQLLFPDAGAAALAQRDAPDLAATIADFRAFRRRCGEAGSEGLLLAVAPGQADYEDFEPLCQQHRGAVVLVNGRLEDAAVGIGSVARERRRGFLAQWQTAYLLQPIEAGALRRAYPDDWEVYREDADGFRLAGRLETRPDPEQLAQILAPEGPGGVAAGVGANLRALDAFVEGLSR